MDHPAITRDRVAVITGAASGIGLAAAQALAARGMRVCLADRDEDKLEQGLATIEGTAISHTTDVADLDSVLALRQRVLDEFGEVALLMNNAGTGAATGSWTELSNWQRIIGVNFWGVVHGLQTFTQQMIDQGTPCAIINTGSKQGITNPPGSPAYNASKAGVKSVTESLAHELRNTEGCQVTAHLLVPGFTYTGMISRFVPEQPPAAWRPEQVVERLLENIGAGDFYVI
ncbi:MAG: SDR family NAD(P)-dependent oxidoreductase, partial [Pseudomonadota bacterium]